MMKLTKKEELLIKSERIQNCAIQYIKRKNREEHPSGRFDSAGRWYPDSDEFLDELNFRTPSRSYPFSYMTACRSILHICNLHDIDEKEEILAVKRAIKIMQNNRIA